MPVASTVAVTANTMFLCLPVYGTVRRQGNSVYRSAKLLSPQVGITLHSLGPIASDFDVELNNLL